MSKIIEKMRMFIHYKLVHKQARIFGLVKEVQEKYSENFFIILIPKFMGKKFRAFCSMKEDLEFIRQYISELRSNPSKIVKSALSYSLISLYGKCFTDASGSGLPKLEPNIVFSNENELLQIHEYLMELRHKFIAHRGDSDGEVAISYMLISKTESNEKTQVRYNHSKIVSFSTEELDKFEVLIKFLIQIVIEKIEKSGQRVKTGMLENFTEKELALMVINNAK